MFQVCVLSAKPEAFLGFPSTHRFCLTLHVTSLSHNVQGSINSKSHLYPSFYIRFILKSCLRTEVHLPLVQSWVHLSNREKGGKGSRKGGIAVAGMKSNVKF